MRESAVQVGQVGHPRPEPVSRTAPADIGWKLAAVNLSVSTAYWSFERAVAELVPKLIHTARMISTTPPTFRAMEPFQIGYGKVRDVPYDKP